MLQRLGGPLGLGLVLLATFAAYVPSLGNGYALDDREAAMGSDAGRGTRPLDELGPSPMPAGEEGAARNRHYRPVTAWSYAAVHRLARPAEIDPADPEHKRTAFPQHLLNVLLHVAAVLVVYALLLRLGVATLASLAGALVFGLHAVHSEVVATVAGRAELLAFVTGGAAVLAACRTIRRGPMEQVLAALVAAVLFFLAYASTETALAWLVIAPLFWLALGWRSGPDAPRDRVQLAALLVAALVPAAVFWGLLGWPAVSALPAAAPPAFAANPLAHEGLGPHLLTAIFVWAWKGLGLTLLPFSLACDHGAMVLPILRSPLDPRFLLAALVLLGLLAGGILAARRHPLLFLAMAAFLGFSFAVSNVPLAIDTVFGERLYYAPSLGLVFLVVWCLERTAAHARFRGVFLAAACAWLGASTLVILERNPVWRSDEMLFLREVSNQPRSIRVRLGAAAIHAGRSEHAAAARHLREALRLDPECARAWSDLGAAHLAAGRLAAAEGCLRAGLGARHVVEAEDRHRLHANLGIVLEQLGRSDEAFAQLVLALRKRPGLERAFTELMELCATPAVAERLLEELEALEIEAPAEARWPYYRGRVLAARSRPTDDVEAAFRTALARDPAFPEPRVALIALLLDARPARDLSAVIAGGDAHAPDRPEWPYYRGLLLARAERQDEALAAFLEALDRDGEFAAAWQEFSNLAAAPEPLRRAVALLQSAASARPHYPYWPHFLGLLLERQDRTPEALWSYGRALAARPGFAPAWRALRALADRLRDYRTLLGVLERAEATHGGGAPEFGYYRGVALKSFGAALEATGTFTRVLRSRPDHLEARLELLDLVHASFPPDEVRAIVRGGVAHHPEDPHWPLHDGLSFCREGRHAEAVSALERALVGLPDHAMARLALADSLASLGRKDDARALYRRLADDPAAPPETRQHAAERASRL
ncbi:MAG: tetratricopeptide repeat protein [Planctomycetes bacterium]|nr:tetratricopeptide repeat protein [Planctomycetota bacterium]